MRKKIIYTKGEYYHIFNKGINKADIFSDKYDVYRFIQSLKEFNRVETGNDIFYINKSKMQRVGYQVPHRRPKTKNLVNIVAYCLNPNHFHFVLEEVEDGGISKFMKRVGGGFSNYYNERYNRCGPLFQGRFKANHIESDEQLLYVSAYVNLNNLVHKKFDGTKKHFMDSILNRSSWNEYIKNYPKSNFCKKDIILDKEGLKANKSYEKYAKETLKMIKEMRYGD